MNQFPKNLLLLFFAFSATAWNGLSAQDTTTLQNSEINHQARHPQNPSNFIVKVKMMNGNFTKGFLTAVTDSSISLTYEEKNRVVRVEDMKVILIYHKNRILRGLGMGLGSAAATGIFIGLIDGDDPPGWFSLTAEEKALLFSIILAVPGLIIGTTAGALTVRERLVIRGSFDRFSARKKILIPYRIYRKT